MNQAKRLIDELWRSTIVKVKPVLPKLGHPPENLDDPIKETNRL